MTAYPSIISLPPAAAHRRRQPRPRGTAARISTSTCISRRRRGTMWSQPAAVTLPKTLLRGVRSALPQPAVGAATATLALFAVLSLWSRAAPGALLPHAWLAVALAGAVALTYRYPIHARHQTKITLSTVVYYLLAVLVPPPLAAVAAGLGALVGEVARRAQSGTYPSDIAAEVGRRVLIMLPAALVAQMGGLPPCVALARRRPPPRRARRALPAPGPGAHGGRAAAACARGRARTRPCRGGAVCRRDRGRGGGTARPVDAASPCRARSAGVRGVQGPHGVAGEHAPTRWRIWPTPWTCATPTPAATPAGSPRTAPASCAHWTCTGPR